MGVGWSYGFMIVLMTCGNMVSLILFCGGWFWCGMGWDALPTCQRARGQGNRAFC